ncbi:GL11778 [Drosophila persimilis]|uniref:GL11778 n=1 Tax=Drosophila persimilis TaxID=7234 RepID=B4H6Y1_DROPE|nr:shugoshin [Drosophila persimilis]EDW33617.1 GL11778 [Drosophila persimilis]
MGTNIEQQYKILNAELMDHVQKLRVELGEYKKLVVGLQTELLEVRESHVLEMDFKKKQLKYGISTLLKNLDLKEDFLTGVTHTTPSVHRRSNIKEICYDMRRISSLTRSSVTCSPSRRRSSTVRAGSGSSSAIITEDATDVDTTTASEDTHRLNIDSAVTPPPRRIAEMAWALEDTDEDSPTIPVVESCEPDEILAALSPCDQADSLFSILEETDSEDAADTSSVEVGDAAEAPISAASRRDRVLRGLCENVPKETGKQEKTVLAIPCHDNDSSYDVSIQKPRQAHSPSLSIETPRQSQFNGIGSWSGSTSTPLPSPVPDIHQKTVSVARGRGRPRGRGSAKPTNNTLSPSDPLSGDADMSSASCSTSGRPSRKCRPTSYKEPKINAKMRNDSLPTKKSSK